MMQNLSATFNDLVAIEVPDSKLKFTITTGAGKACSTCVSFGFFAAWCCLERQRGCGKIGLLLRPIFPPLDGTCPARTWWALATTCDCHQRRFWCVSLAGAGP